MCVRHIVCVHVCLSMLGESVSVCSCRCEWARACVCVRMCVDVRVCVICTRPWFMAALWP